MLLMLLLQFFCLQCEGLLCVVHPRPSRRMRTPVGSQNTCLAGAYDLVVSALLAIIIGLPPGWCCQDHVPHSHTGFM